MYELAIILALILLNAVFAGAEIAIVSVRRTRIEELLSQGSRRAQALARLRGDPERFLATVQVGITLVGTTAAAFGGSALAEDLAPFFSELPVIGARADDAALAVIVVLVATLSIVVGELVPKSLALRYAEPYALLVSPVLVVLAQIARPVVWALVFSSNLVLKIFGDHTSFTEGRLSRDEIQQLVEEAATAGTLDPGVGEIASRALGFSDLDVSDLMVPRHAIVAIPVTTPVEQLSDVALTHGHARVLVHEGDLDQVIGFVNLREALARADREPGLTLREAVRTVPFAPESMSAPGLLRELQRQRSHLAVVLDELGTVRGLVTVEDLVEELVGEIVSENDRLPPAIGRASDGSLLVDATMPVHEVSRALGEDLPESETYSTLAGLCIELAGRIPAAGEVLTTAEGTRLEVVEATQRRVRRVRVHPAPQPVGDEDAPSSA